MKKTIIGLLSLGCVLIIGCTQQKIEKSESLRDAYFQISEKIVNKEEISSKYIKKLLNGYDYKKDEELKIEGGNTDESDYIQQPYTFTNGNESLNITYSNLNNEEQIQPLYTLKDENGETNLSILISDMEDEEFKYMYTASRENLKSHKDLFKKLDNNGKWHDAYLKVIDNIGSTNNMDIQDIKNILGTDYSINEYPYDEKSSLGLDIIQYVFENDDGMFIVEYTKDKDKIFSVFYNDKNNNTINTVINNKLIDEKKKLHTGIIAYV